MSPIPTEAIPVIAFFSFAAFEALVTLLFRRNYYRLSDTVTSVFMGLSMALYGMLYLSGAYLFYSYCYDKFHLFEFSKTSAISFLLGMVLFDFLSYVFHVAEHKINFMWASHATHHHSEDFNLTTAFRQPITGGASSWLFFSPMAFLGLPLEIIVICNTIHIFYQFIIHTKFVPSLGFLDYILITPTNHSVHHASNDEYLDKNFGSILVVWDILFKTFAREDKKIKIHYGVTRCAKSFNVLWLNTAVYKSMIERMFKSRSLKEIFVAIFGAPYDPNAKDEPDPSTGFVFSPLLNGFIKGYCSLQALLITLAGMAVFWIHHSADIIQSTFSFIMVLISMMNIGKLLEADERYLWVEAVKFLFLIGVFGSGVMHWNNAMSLFVFGWSGISLLIILAYQGFSRQSKATPS